MQIHQRRNRYARFAQLHVRAGGCIQHPCSHNRDDAGSELYVDDRAACALLAVEPSNRAAIERMPRVLDDGLLPDMGRMSGASPSGDPTGCSPDPFVQESVPRRS